MHAGSKSAHEAVVLEFLRSTQQVIAAQKEVMLGLLGTGTSSLPEGSGMVDGGVALPARLVVPSPVTAVASLPGPELHVPELLVPELLVVEPEPVATPTGAPRSAEGLLDVILGIVIIVAVAYDQLRRRALARR